MRRILINRARDKNRLKRGGPLQRLNLDNIEFALETPSEEILALDEALQRLSEENSGLADLVKLRFFAGLSNREAAEALGISSSTADRYWAYSPRLVASGNPRRRCGRWLLVLRQSLVCGFIDSGERGREPARKKNREKFREELR